MEEKLITLDAKVEKLISTLGDAFATVDKNVGILKKNINAISLTLESIEGKVDTIDHKVDVLQNNDVPEVKSGIKNIQEELAKIEKVTSFSEIFENSQGLN